MKIIEKKVLSDTEQSRIVAMTIVSPDIAQKAQPGEFIVVMADERGERLPLTIVSADRESGTIGIIFQETGFTTKLLGALSEGDNLYALTGPLGHPSEIKNYGNVIVVGGGVGIAEVFPVAKALSRAGNCVTAVLGARTKEVLILEKEMREVCHKCLIATDDGSSGKKGLVTDILTELFDSACGAQDYSFVYAVGPVPMMRAVARVTKHHRIKTTVSLNALMVDATGMCGSCRVTVGGKVRFSCVDGPEFDAHQVDWQELSARNSVYHKKERHICKLKTL